MVQIAVIVVALLAPALLGVAVWGSRRQQRGLALMQAHVLDSPLLVVIPARNEEDRIGATLDQLLKDPSPHLRFVVVDDRSTDRTAEIVRRRDDPRLQLLAITTDPPPGTFGKPRALAAAVAAHTDTDLIAVVDADVVVTPGLFGALVRARRETGADAISGLPRLLNHTFEEHLLVPAFVAAVAISHPPAAVNAGRCAFLNGQLFVVRHSALADVGGFDAVGRTVLEDVALARLLHTQGKKLLIVDASGLASTRMYSSLAQIIEGFGKNARAIHGVKLVPLGLLLASTAWLPWLSVGAALVTTGAADDVGAGLALAACIALMMINRHALKSPMWLAIFSPLAQTVVAAVFVRAALVRRGSWRGRTLST